MSKKDYPVTIGDNTYLVRFNYDALTYIEDVSGKSFSEFLGDLKSLKSIKLLFQAGLKKNHPALTGSKVAELLDECEELRELVTMLVQGVENYFNKSKAAESDAKKKEVSAAQTAE